MRSDSAWSVCWNLGAGGGCSGRGGGSAVESEVRAVTRGGGGGGLGGMYVQTVEEVGGVAGGREGEWRSEGRFEGGGGAGWKTGVVVSVCQSISCNKGAMSDIIELYFRLKTYLVLAAFFRHPRELSFK